MKHEIRARSALRGLGGGGAEPGRKWGGRCTGGGETAKHFAIEKSANRLEPKKWNQDKRVWKAESFKSPAPPPSPYYSVCVCRAIEIKAMEDYFPVVLIKYAVQWFYIQGAESF